MYNLPWFKEQHGFTGQGPWRLEVSGLVYCYTGTPLTVTTSNTDRGGLGLLGASASSARPDLVSNPNDGAQHSVASFFNTAAFLATPLDADRPGNAGRGVVTSPSFQCCDFSLFQNTKLPCENMYLQFRAETFNLLNHTNFSTVTTSFSSASFGKVTAASDARIMQLGLKLYF